MLTKKTKYVKDRTSNVEKRQVDDFCGKKRKVGGCKTFKQRLLKYTFGVCGTFAETKRNKVAILP